MNKFIVLSFFLLLATKGFACLSCEPSGLKPLPLKGGEECMDSYDLAQRGYAGSSSGSGANLSEAYSMASSSVPIGAVIYKTVTIKGVAGQNWTVTILWRKK